MEQGNETQEVLLNLLVNAQGLIGEGRWQEATVRIADARRILEAQPEQKKPAKQKIVKQDYMG